MVFSFDEIGTFVVVLIGLLGFVILVSNASSAYGKFKSKLDEPLDKVEHRVDGLEDRMDKVEEKLNGDWEFRQEELEFNKLVLQSMKQIVKHLTRIADDDEEQKRLETVENDIDGYLVEHQG